MPRQAEEDINHLIEVEEVEAQADLTIPAEEMVLITIGVKVRDRCTAAPTFHHGPLRVPLCVQLRR